MAIGGTINRCEIEGRVKWRVASASHGRDDGAPIYGWTGAQPSLRPRVSRKTAADYAALWPGSTRIGAALGEVSGWVRTSFISSQSYGNSFPHSRQTTYVPVTEATALRRSLPRTVIGKLQCLCEQPNSKSNRLMRILLRTGHRRSGWRGLSEAITSKDGNPGPICLDSMAEEKVWKNGGTLPESG